MKVFAVPNKSVALEPFPTLAVEKQIKGGFATAKQKEALYGLKVVFGDEEGNYQPGMTCYVRGEHTPHDWVRKIYEVDGKKFIIVPTMFVAIVEAEFPGGTGGPSSAE